MFHHFLLSFLEVLKALSLFALYMIIFYRIRLSFSCHTFTHKRFMCGFSFVCFNIVIFCFKFVFIEFMKLSY
jgi:hypothetical protein